MNKYVLASLAVVIAGVFASPADAAIRRAGGEPVAEAVAPKGPAREEREEDREDRRVAREAVRDARREQPQVQPREDRGMWAGRGDDRSGDARRQDRPGDRFPGAVARVPVQAPAYDASRVREIAHDGDRNRDDDRDYDRTRDRDYDRDDRRDRDHAQHDGRRNIDWRNEWRNDRRDWNGDGRRGGNYYTRYRDARWSGYNWYPQYRYRAPTRYIHPYGYRPYRWTVGYQMPYGYYSPRAYWLDWRMYRLPMPPYGYQWVRVDRDVVLVSMASGFIRDVLYGVFW